MGFYANDERAVQWPQSGRFPAGEQFVIRAPLRAKNLRLTAGRAIAHLPQNSHQLLQNLDASAGEVNAEAGVISRRAWKRQSC